jgi:hypothetical protein
MGNGKWEMGKWMWGCDVEERVRKKREERRKKKEKGKKKEGRGRPRGRI